MENCFQIYDWYSFDEQADADSSSDSDSITSIKQEYVVYLFCVTPQQQNVSIKITGFTPFFWIELPNNWKPWYTSLLYEQLRNELPKLMRDEIVMTQLNSKPRYRYRFRDYQWDKPRPFMQLIFKSEAALRKIYYV